MPKVVNSKPLLVVEPFSTEPKLAVATPATIIAHATAKFIVTARTALGSKGSWDTDRVTPHCEGAI